MKKSITCVIVAILLMTGNVVSYACPSIFSFTYSSDERQLSLQIFSEHFKDDVEANYNRWNGITSNCNISTLYKNTGGIDYGADIKVKDDYVTTGTLLGVCRAIKNGQIVSYSTQNIDYCDIYLTVNVLGNTSWYNYTNRSRTITHEIGHALGLSHLPTSNCSHRAIMRQTKDPLHSIYITENDRNSLIAKWN